MRASPWALRLGLALSWPAASAAAATWTPLAVHVDCQASGRSDACQAARALLNDWEVIALVPRSDARVVLYITVTEQANDDMVFLRAVGDVEGAPAAFEQLVAIDSRDSIDARRADLEQPLLRALAPYVAVAVPDGMQIELNAPEAATEVERPDRPWGVTAWVGGWGYWTEDYQSLSVWDGASGYRVTDQARFTVSVWHDRSIDRQPALDVEGHEVSLSVDTQGVGAELMSAYNLTDHWSLGAYARGGHDDPEGQFLGTVKAHAGAEYNWFPSDDPRGNRVAVCWLVGAQADWYNQVNQLGELQAFFPTQIFIVEGDLRRDSLDLSLSGGVGSEIFHPGRRTVAAMDADMSWNVGDHVDLGFSMGLTRQVIPGPADVDSSDYEEVTRANYAQPLRVYGDTHLRVHWDNNNGARNNRFDSLWGLDATGNL